MVMNTKKVVYWCIFKYNIDNLYNIYYYYSPVCIHTGSQFSITGSPKLPFYTYYID